MKGQRDICLSLKIVGVWHGVSFFTVHSHRIDYQPHLRSKQYFIRAVFKLFLTVIAQTDIFSISFVFAGISQCNLQYVVMTVQEVSSQVNSALD